ncbi:MAG: tetratricopeptide repeat protein [Candidatus Sumerlaeaceae bacterium]|nr:tetratricopeptide repeat protein [Candidatus Sumerlaeaceae bacterium]
MKKWLFLLAIAGVCAVAYELWIKPSSLEERGSSQEPVATRKASARSTPAPSLHDPPVYTVLRDEDRFPLPPEVRPLELAPEPDLLTSGPVVFLAPFLNLKGDRQTSASVAFRKLMRWGLLGNGSGPRAINLIGDNIVLNVFGREGVPDLIAHVRSRDAYVAEAALVGSGYYVDARVDEAGNGTGLTVELYLADLVTSRVQGWRGSGRPEEIATLLRDAIGQVAGFCNIPGPRAESMLADKPGFATWKWVYDDKATTESLDAMLEMDPNSRALYGLGAAAFTKPEIVNRYANAGLSKWPDDWRLLFAKARGLREGNRPYGALVLTGELLRQQPLNFELLEHYPWMLRSFFVTSSDAKKTPAAYLVADQMYRRVLELAPRNWYLRMRHARLLNSLSWYVRGGSTVDKIPEEFLEEAAKYNYYSTRQMDEVLADQDHCPSVYSNILEFYHAAGENDLQTQRNIVERIHAIDPGNVSAELTVAFSHSVGWDNPKNFLPLVTESAKRHWNRPYALNQISDTIHTDLMRLVGFKVATEAQVYAPNPESKLYVAVTERAIEGGQVPMDYQAETLRKIYQAAGEEAKIMALVRSGKVPCFALKVAGAKYEEGQYEAALECGKIASRSEMDINQEELALWYQARALAGLKRFDEGMEVSREGLRGWPTKGTFYYTYALNEYGKGSDIQHAFQFAEKAWRESPNYDVYIKLYKEIGARLGRKVP